MGAHVHLAPLGAHVRLRRDADRDAPTRLVRNCQTRRAGTQGSVHRLFCRERGSLSVSDARALQRTGGRQVLADAAGEKAVLSTNDDIMSPAVNVNHSWGERVEFHSSN